MAMIMGLHELELLKRTFAIRDLEDFDISAYYELLDKIGLGSAYSWLDCTYFCVSGV
jgi:hypothetical protein